MEKTKIIRRTVGIGKRELKSRFEDCYGKSEFTVVECRYSERTTTRIKLYLEDINELASKQRVPFKVEVLEDGTVKFSCSDDNTKVIRNLIKEGW